MPLTFDLTTLTWIQTRVCLWLRQRRGLLSALLLSSLSGCVPITRYEAAQSAERAAVEGRRQAEESAKQLGQQSQALARRLRQQRDDLDQREQALAQASLDTTTQGKQREDAEGLVEQLRGELARVGGHLRSFNDDKLKLEASRQAEAARSHTQSRVTRDLTLLVAEPLATGEYSLEPEQDQLQLRVPRDKVLAADGSVKPEAGALIKALARVMSLHADLRLAVADAASKADPLVVGRLVTALTDNGVAGERLTAVSVQAAPEHVQVPATSLAEANVKLLLLLSD